MIIAALKSRRQKCMRPSQKALLRRRPPRLIFVASLLHVAKLHLGAMIKRTLYAIAVYCFNGQNRIFNNFLQLRKKIRKENSPNKLAQSQVPSPNRPDQMQRSVRKSVACLILSKLWERKLI